MAKKQQKGKSGNAPKYITRNQALNRLQIKLPEFRRLCILKGIHPREPKKKTQGTHKTYYHVKDMDFLAHEPLLHISRQVKAVEKKVRRARMRQEQDLAQRLEKMKPHHSLDHLVRERYPAFVDALRDLDDALSLIHLFAVLPAEKSLGIPSERVHASRRLSLEWQAYVTRTNSLRKVFVSVKGIYFQAEVVGQRITWIVPHALSQVIPIDVDFRVMLTFLEFYQAMVSFVNFKLYHELGMPYPPVLDARLEQAAAELYDVMRLLAEASKAKLEAAKGQSGKGEKRGEEKEQSEKGEGETGNLKDEEQAKEGDTEKDKEEKETEKERAGKLQQLTEEEASARLAALQERLTSASKAMAESAEGGQQAQAQAQAGEEGEAATGEQDDEEDEETRQCRGLFKGLVFFLSREVPREPLLFLVRSFGGTATWEGEEAPLPESDRSITHHVVDRPDLKKQRKAREYVQPQWVFDSVNARIQLPTKAYAPGLPPPPHLSPFVDNHEEGYKPDYALVVERLKAAAATAAEAQRQRQAAGAAGAPEAAGAGEAVQLLDGAEREVESQAHLQALAASRTEERAAAAKLAEAEEQERLFSQELAQERAGVPFSTAAQAEGRAAKQHQEEEEEEEEEEDKAAAGGRPKGQARGQKQREEEGGEAGEEGGEGEGVPGAPAEEDEEAEAREMARLMMPRKKQKLYEAMQIGKARKQAAVSQIMERKKQRVKQQRVRYTDVQAPSK